MIKRRNKINKKGNINVRLNVANENKFKPLTLEEMIYIDKDSFNKEHLERLKLVIDKYEEDLIKTGDIEKSNLTTINNLSEILSQNFTNLTKEGLEDDERYNLFKFKLTSKVNNDYLKELLEKAELLIMLKAKLLHLNNLI